MLGIGGEPAVVRVTMLDDDASDDDASAGANALDPADDDPDAYPDDSADAADPQPADLADFAPGGDGFFDDDDDDEETSEVVRVGYDVLSTLLTYMDVSADVYLKDDEEEEGEDGGDAAELAFEIEGEDSGLLIGTRGETLRALQFVVGFIVNRRLGERVNLFIDVEGYQQRRYDSVINLARRVSQRVAASGRSIALEPMPPNERRQVHMSLADSADVYTESDGAGDDRRVVIYPK